MAMNEPQPSDVLEMTEKHVAIVTNQILSLMSTSLQSAKNTYEAEKALIPLVSAFTALHSGLVSSRQARSTQADPQAQLELEKQKMQHEHALDIMKMQFEEQMQQQKMELEKMKADQQMQLQERKANAEEERAGLQNAQLATQIQNQQEDHHQQQQHAEQNHQQTLSNTDEMHKTQVQQAKAKQSESISEN